MFIHFLLALTLVGFVKSNSDEDYDVFKIIYDKSEKGFSSCTMKAPNGDICNVVCDVGETAYCVLDPQKDPGIKCYCTSKDVEVQI